MTRAEFERIHVVRFRRVLRLRKPPRRTDDCRFLTKEGCSIHAVKPTQCRTYPFWPGLIESKASWTLEGTFCPGIGQGELIQIEAAREIASEMPAAYPTLPGF